MLLFSASLLYKEMRCERVNLIMQEERRHKGDHKAA